MNINLNNYEQWLLLYVDNELSLAERSGVEAFLKEYSYLQHELEALQQATLPIENLLLDSKKSLLKSFINEEDREKMLLQLDKELSATEKSALQKNIDSNNALQTEWASLQKAQLNKAEIIPFPDKKLLYKKENSRVLSMGFVRWVAAAMVIGLGFYFATTFRTNNTGTQAEFSSNTQGGDTATTKSTDDNIAAISPSATNTTQNEEAKSNKQNTKNISTKNNAIAVTNNNASRTIIKEHTVSKQANNKIAQPNNLSDVVTNNATDNKKKEQKDDMGFTALNNKVLPSLNDIAALPNKPGNNSIDLSTQINSPKKEILDINARTIKNTYAQTAAYAFDENNNSVLMLEEEDITRSKAGIFLKKVKRNIERRANIKPGKSLKIAGFELAVK